MAEIADGITELIGNTPLLRLKRVTRGLAAEVLAKVEFFNPGLSLKDRTALGMIEGAERRGLLKPGSVVVSQTSGNLGTGLAIVCAARGYHMVAVM